MTRTSFRLYLITDPSNDRVLAITEAALRAAPPRSIAVQARNKGASAREIAEFVRALLPICRASGAPLLVNDRADVAKAAGADGVHLPEAGLSVADARAVLGPNALVGRSCHDREGLERAARDGADFATLGPVGAVPGKGVPLGVEGFAASIRGLAIPIYALGGVNAANAQSLRDAGAAGLAVIRAVYGAGDPARIVRALL